jgi:hypothetical protein
MARKTKTEDEFISSVYINPLTDFGFKKLFNDKELLIAFPIEIVAFSTKLTKKQLQELTKGELN